MDVDRVVFGQKQGKRNLDDIDTDGGEIRVEPLSDQKSRQCWVVLDAEGILPHEGITIVVELSTLKGSGWRVYVHTDAMGGTPSQMRVLIRALSVATDWANRKAAELARRLFV